MHETDKHQCHVEVCSGYMDKTGNGADGRQGCKVTLKPDSTFVIGTVAREDLMHTFPLKIPEADKAS